jgi:hypothetical protein
VVGAHSGEAAAQVGAADHVVGGDEQGGRAALVQGSGWGWVRVRVRPRVGVRLRLRLRARARVRARVRARARARLRARVRAVAPPGRAAGAAVRGWAARTP